jgi:formate dehydrogenase assembly factor FdhD
MAAMRSLPSRQKLNVETRAVHAGGLLERRERHRCPARGRRPP